MDSFDVGVNRAGTKCLKWDMRKQVFNRADVIPLWVADMDFAAPQPVIDALVERARHGAFGYSADDTENADAVVNWMRHRHHVELNDEAVLASPGVVDSMNVAVAAFSKKGDKILIPTPVYGPFYGSAESAGCEICRSPLIRSGNSWMMDFDNIEDILKKGARIILLCNPHNPIGRVWTREELETLSDLARRYDAIIISDEIHADLELPGHHNTSILKVEPHAIALVSATKTFNLAALRHSSALIPDPELRQKFQTEYRRRGINGINLFGALAQRVAYEKGESWLNELILYLDETRQIVETFIQKELPILNVSPLQATYLMWINMSALGLEQKELEQFCIEKAGLGLGSGTGFGEEGKGYMRMNIATPRHNVIKALEQLKSAMHNEGYC